MKKLITLIFLASTTLFASNEYFNSQVLFCLKKNHSALDIRYENGIVVTGNEKLDTLFKKYQVTQLGKWLTSARETDIDGDVKLANIYRARFISEKTPEQLERILADFRRAEDVYDAHLEEIYRITAQTGPYNPNDTRFNEQWYLNKIMANYAWGLWNTPAQTPGDSTILIGIVDTGADYDHPDIAGAMYWNLGEDINGDGVITEADVNGIDDDGSGKIDDFRGWDFAGANSAHVQDNDVKPPQAGPDSELSHGTHCGGIVAAVSDNATGIASVSFSSKLIFTKHATDDDLTQPGIYNSVDGMLYCAQMGADIINCSFGGPGYNPFTQNTINNIVTNYGSIIVCAAGNENLDNDVTHHYPSDYTNTIAISATTVSDAKAYYSNYGSVIDLSAPGGEGSSSGNAILSTIHVSAGSYTAWQGTSMASPVAAGAFALLKAFFPAQSRTWIINEMLANADPIDDLNPSYAGQLGSGRVNVYNAIARNIYPYLTISEHTVSVADNNGDGELNPGEGGSLEITLNNDPLWLDANSASVVLSSTSPYITFSDNTADYGLISAGASSANTGDALTFGLSADATLEPITVYVAISANPAAEYTYQVIDSIQVQPALNQEGFPVLTGTEILLPVSCDSLFGDGTKQVIALAADDSVYVYSAAGELSDGFPVYGGYSTSAPIVADMDGDGQKEIVIANRIGTIKIINNDGSLMLDQVFSEQIHGNAAVANMDGDLDLEIIFGTMSRNLHVINLDGSSLPGFPINHLSPIQKGVAVGDLTGDGVPEIAFGLLNAEFHVLTANADTLVNFPVTLNSRVNSAPVIAQIKSTTNEYHIFVNTLNNEVQHIELTGAVSVLYDSPVTLNSQPALCDINNDGSLDILFGTDNGKLYAFNFGGDSLQNFPVHLNGKLVTSPSFADFDNDDQLEMVIGSDSGKLYVLKNNGTPYQNFPASYPASVRGSGTIGDLDDDGDLEVIFGVGDGLKVIDAAGTKGSNDYWNTYMSSNTRTGVYLFEPVPSAIAREAAIPTQSNLMQNYPNPFNPETTIQYTLSGPGRVELTIFNVLGQLVQTLVQSRQNAGAYQAGWDGRDKSGQRVVSGVYFYKLTIESDEGQLSAFIKKMLLVR